MQSADREEMRREIASLEELADTFAQVMPSDFASEEELDLWEKEARERAAALTRALSDMKLTKDREAGDGGK